MEVLRKELGRVRVPQAELWPDAGSPARGFILLGGGVSDSYQAAEARYGLARKTLELLEELSLPVHVLTKSCLVLRDADVLERIARRAGALVSFSLSSADDALAAVFEPGASPPSQRLRALAELGRRGIDGGVFLMPVIGETVEAAARAGARYVIFGGMTLKQGRQREHFLATLAGFRPELVARFADLYTAPAAGRPDWGNAAGSYYERITRLFAAAARRTRVAPRIPRPLFQRILAGRDLAAVLLDHVRAFLQLEGRAARSGSSAMLTREILATGTCAIYERLISEYQPVHRCKMPTLDAIPLIPPAQG
jgi:hypothetical protein